MSTDCVDLHDYVTHLILPLYDCAQWRTQWVAWVGPGLPTNLVQNSITTLEKLVQMLSFVSAQAEDTVNP